MSDRLCIDDFEPELRAAAAAIQAVLDLHDAGHRFRVSWYRARKVNARLPEGPNPRAEYDAEDLGLDLLNRLLNADAELKLRRAEAAIENPITAGNDQQKVE